MKRFALRCLGLAALVLLSVFSYTSLRHNKWLSVPVVRADGTPLKDLFEGLPPTEASIYVLDQLRAEARREARARRPAWLNAFLDIFDNTVVHAEDLPGCDQKPYQKEVKGTWCAPLEDWNKTCGDDPNPQYRCIGCKTTVRGTEYGCSIRDECPWPGYGGIGEFGGLGSCCDGEPGHVGYPCTRGCNPTCGGSKYCIENLGVEGQNCSLECACISELRCISLDSKCHACRQLGEACGNAYDCCEGRACEGSSSKKCCLAVQASCSSPSECCSGFCSGSGKCCLSNEASCSNNEDCCSGHCSGGQCVAEENCEERPCQSVNDCCVDYYCSAYNQCEYNYSPVLIDLQGDGFAMTSAASGVFFDFLGNVAPLKLSWTARGSDDAWLALDRNGNGMVDNGAELFGNATPLPGGGRAKNGFEALAVYDLPQYGGNGDGVIDAPDAAYRKLLLWVDQNHDGISQPGELLALAQAGIVSIDLKYHKSPFTDRYGNKFRYRAKVTDRKSTSVGKWAFDVFLQRDAGTSALGSSSPRLPGVSSSPARKNVVRR